MKRKTRSIMIAFLFVLFIAITLYFLLDNQSAKLTSEEKQWISNNASKIQNVHILNDTNIFGNLGTGIYYEFLDNVSKEYGLQLNPITITKEEVSSELSLLVGNTLPNNALNFYEDHYVLISQTKEVVSSIEYVTNKKIGILNSESEYIKKHLGAQNNTYVDFKNITELFSALDKGDVTSIILPRIEYIDKILSKKYWITYHFSDLKRYYYINDESNGTFFQILKKYFQKWSKENLETKIYEKERTLFKENLNISDTALADLQKTTLSYGYMNHLPYEVYGDRTFGGILSKYMGTFAKFADLDIEYTKYTSEKKMTKDLNNGKITLYFNYNNFVTNSSTIETNIPLSFAIYVHESNPIVIESTNSLKGLTIYVEENTVLYQNLSTIEGIKLKTYKPEKINSILKKKDTILAIDSRVGKYLQKTILKKYIPRYYQDLTTGYSIKSLGNETLNTLLTKYINYLDTNILINKGIYNATTTESKGSFINSLAKYALYGIVITAIILLLIYRSSKKVRIQKKLKKEDKLKFIDHLTSLKNRNYLNENLNNWNKNTIYPQSVIMIDLNRVQEINDTLGYEEGDRQIRGAANSLIKTQLDNTDIIRTNGNEFMIYLVGYNQKQVTSYMHKLSKELKNLPYDYGVCMTYSMIIDDLKSVEDAVNECVEDIKKQKESQKEEEE